MKYYLEPLQDFSVLLQLIEFPDLQYNGWIPVDNDYEFRLVAQHSKPGIFYNQGKSYVECLTELEKVQIIKILASSPSLVEPSRLIQKCTEEAIHTGLAHIYQYSKIGKGPALELDVHKLSNNYVAVQLRNCNPQLIRWVAERPRSNGSVRFAVRSKPTLQKIGDTYYISLPSIPDIDTVMLLQLSYPTELDFFVGELTHAVRVINQLFNHSVVTRANNGFFNTLI